MQFIAAARGAMFGILAGVAAFGGDDKLAARQKFLANLHRLIEQPAGIPAQVQNQRLHALALQFLQRHFQIVAGFFAELHQANVANFVFAERKFLLAVNILDHVDIDDRARELVILHLAGGRGAGCVMLTSVSGSPRKHFHGVRQASCSPCSCRRF